MSISVTGSKPYLHNLGGGVDSICHLRNFEKVPLPYIQIMLTGLISPTMH